MPSHAQILAVKKPMDIFFVVPSGDDMIADIIQQEQPRLVARRRVDYFCSSFNTTRALSE